MAETHLLPLVLEDGQTTVAAFGRKQHTLEDVFMRMVEGGKPNGRG
jgi:hypothetical protein